MPQEKRQSVIKEIYEDLVAKGIKPQAHPDERLICIGTLVGKGKRVLDIGCGDGLVIGYLSMLGNQVVGLDVAESAVLACKQKGLVAYQLDIEQDPLPHQLGMFDVIVATEILEHLFDPYRVLKGKVNNLLLEGGILIVSVPNSAYFRHRLQLLFGKIPTFGAAVWLEPYRPYNLQHKTLFTINALIETLEMAGFEIMQVFPTPGYVPRIVSRLSIQFLWNIAKKLFPGLFVFNIMCVARKTELLRKD